MLLKNVYEKVILLGANMPAASFVAAFNHFSDYLLAKYGEEYVRIPNSDIAPAITVDSDVSVMPEYEGAYVDHILGEAMGDANRKADAVAKAEFAYKIIWGRKVKGKRILRERWY